MDKLIFKKIMQQTALLLLTVTIISWQLIPNLSSVYIYAHNNAIVIASVVNATVDQVAYTSFESAEKGYWTYTGNPSGSGTDPGRTGRKYYLLTAGSLQRTNLLQGKYIISYWSQNGAATVTGTNCTLVSTVNNRTISGWSYYEHIVSLSTNVNNVTLTGTAKVDELRLYPIEAQMTTLTYDPIMGKTSSTDVNNVTTFYEYDAFNRLKCIKDQYGNIREHYVYHYKNQL